MTSEIADHWGKGDVYSLIVSALNKMSKPLDGLTLEDLASVDHFTRAVFPQQLNSRIYSRSRSTSTFWISAAGWAAPLATWQTDFNAR